MSEIPYSGLAASELERIINPGQVIERTADDPVPHSTVYDLQWAALQVAHMKGFTPGDFSETAALIHSEISEAHEEYRSGHDVDDVYMSHGGEKPEGVPVELADAVIRIMHWFQWRGLDLDAIIRMKLAYNLTRPMRHGKKF